MRTRHRGGGGRRHALLPRIGARLWLADEPAEGAPVSWLGLGPTRITRIAGSPPIRSLAIAHRGVAHPYVFPTDNGLRCDTRALQLGIWRWRGASTSASAATVSSSWPGPSPDRSVALGHAPVPRWLPHGVGGDDSWSQSVRPGVLAVAGALSVALPSELAGPAVARWREKPAVSHVTI